MYRVTVRVGGAMRSREFEDKQNAMRFYNAVRRQNKNVWFFDLTDKPKSDKVKTVEKVLAFLDKMCGN